jgi:hypothetical protein
MRCSDGASWHARAGIDEIGDDTADGAAKRGGMDKTSCVARE